MWVLLVDTFLWYNFAPIATVEIHTVSTIIGTITPTSTGVIVADTSDEPANLSR